MLVFMFVEETNSVPNRRAGTFDYIIYAYAFDVFIVPSIAIQSC